MISLLPEAFVISLTGLIQRLIADQDRKSFFDQARVAPSRWGLNHEAAGISVGRDGKDRRLLGCPRVCETHANEGPEEQEGPLAQRVSGVDVEPPIAEANPNGGVVRTLLGGTDRDESTFLRHRPRDRHDDSGLEVRLGDLDVNPENLATDIMPTVSS